MEEPFSKNIQTELPKRLLGQTGFKLSIIGMGGIVVMNSEPAHAAVIVQEAIEKGINYFDVAPSYGDAELKLGPALKPHRKNVFLACKTALRDRMGAKEELDNSLKHLETNHLELYQLHALTDVEKDVKRALSKDGAIQTFIEAKKAGIIRFIGFSAHSPQAALTAMREFDFDTILYPVNFCTHFRNKFEQAVLAEAKKRNMGILALKAMAKQKWDNDESPKRKAYSKCWYEPLDDPELAKLALNWTLSQRITAALPPGEEKLFRLAMELAPNYRTITAEQTSQLEKAAKDFQPIFTT
ncbi:MAG: aldo/keto reductase [Planctomycetaceae bacterium]|nr:aldo/keto reductase [Planctomycetaceae bacterium]